VAFAARRVVLGGLAATVVVGSLALVVSAGDVTARTQDPPQPVFRSGVRVVRVDVSVTGRDDRPVADLTAADFLLEEDGVPQTVGSAQFVERDGYRQGDTDSLRIRSQEHAEAEAARDDVRLFAIFLDDYHIDRQPSVTIPLRKGLLSFLDRLGPADLAVWMDPLTPLSALRFTRDYEEIKAVVRGFEGRQGEIFPIKSAMEEEQLSARNLRMVRAEVTLSALAALVTRLGNLREGRKSVIFVSQGPPTMFGFDGNVESTMREVVQAANRGNVTINVLDPRGLREQGWGGRDTLLRLAAETGGRQVVNTNHLDRGLEDVLRDASAYYLLGYTPTRSEDDGKFHRIGVKVKRPGMEVLARRGYWAPDPRDVAAAITVAAAPVAPELTEAMTPMAVSATGRIADVWIGLSAGQTGGPRLLVTWEPPAAGRDGVPAVTIVEVERLTPVPAPGLEAAAVGPPQALESARGLRPAGRVGVFDVEPGQATLRFTALAEDGSTADRWTQDVHVPDLAGVPLVLGSPALRRARSPLELRAIGEQPGSPPAAARAFRRTDRVLVDVSCFGALSGQARLDVDLLNRAGQRLVGIPVPAPADGVTRFELPVASLARSTYLMRITATAGTHRAERLEAFEVVP
jgi:VWFA-related protein